MKVTFSDELQTQNIRPPEQFDYLLFGDVGVGKSTFFSNFDNPHFITTDPGWKNLDIRHPFEVSKWSHFLSYLTWMEKHKDDEFKNVKFIVIDRVDDLYWYCRGKILKDMSITHPSESSNGKAWDNIKQEWLNALFRLSGLGRGIGFISHAKLKKFKEYGKEVNKWDCSLSEHGGLPIKAGVNHVFLAKKKRIDKQERSILITQATSTSMTKSNYKLPEEILLDYDVFKEELTKAQQKES
jgi:GTPase SAR1 family protein